MTNDEILASYLDRSLSEDGLLDLETRMANSPEFASHVREMVTLEGVLTSTDMHGSAPAGFLQSVEDTIASKVVTSGSASSSFLSSTAASWIGGSLATLAVVGGVYLGTRSSDNPAPHATPAVIQQSIPGASVPTAPVIQESAQQPAQPQPPSNVGSQPSLSSTKDINTKNPDPAEAGLKLRLAQSSKMKDYSTMYSVGMALGNWYSRNNDNQLSTSAFEQALFAARELKIDDKKVNALTELGRAYIQQRNFIQARSILTEAVSIGSNSGLDATMAKDLLQKLP